MIKNYNTHQRDLQTDNTKVDTPIQRASGTGTVTWVDFIDFRKVEEFGYGNNRQSIGGSWLDVLERLENLFNDLDSRIKVLNTKVDLYHGDPDSTIIGSGNFGSNTVIQLQTAINCDWSLISGSNYFTVNPTTGRNVEVTYIGGSTPFGKGTIRCENDNQTIIISGNGSSISYSYTGGSPNTINGMIKAMNTNDSSDFHTLELIKPSIYQNAGEWSYEYDTSKFQRTDSNSNGTITLKPINIDANAECTLICRNSNASNTVSKTISYTAAVQTYTVSLSVTNGSKSPTGNQTVNSGGSVSWTITPNQGYQMPSSINGGTISGNTVTFSNITSNKQFTLDCVQATYTVSLSVTNGSKSPNSNQTVNSGGSVSWTITPDSGYQMPTTVNGGTISGNTVTFSNITSNKQFSLTCIQPDTQYWYYFKGTLNGTTYENTGITADNYTNLPGIQQVAEYPSSDSYTNGPSNGFFYMLVKSDKTVDLKTSNFNVVYNVDTESIPEYKIIKSNVPMRANGSVDIYIS